MSIPPLPDEARLRRAAETACVARSPAHDFLHVLRVTANARQIAAVEGARAEIVVPAALLHELFNFPKDHPDSALSGEVCATRAESILRDAGCPDDLVEPICYCIRVHPFSRGVVPETLEGRVLQDADRLDAIGAIGVARCFASCAELGTPFYAPDDPFCAHREPDDKRWGLDHFYRKLLRIPDGLHTAAARSLAVERVAFLRAFLARLAAEVAGE